MNWLLHTLWLSALIYAGICFVYFIIQENFIFVPTLPGPNFTPRLHTEAEEHFIETSNHGRIHGLLLKVPGSRGLVFYLHGNTGSLKRWQFMAEEISGYGWDVFVMDYRGYGQSKGKRSEAIMHRDAEECYDKIAAGYEKTIVYGRSLGSGFAVRLTSRKKVRHLILETPFLNLADVASHHMPFVPVKFLLRYRFRNDFFIRHINCPVTLFHGTRDIVVPYQSALNLYNIAKIKGNAEMVTIVGGKHSNLNSFPLFRDELKKIFQKES
ncbi:MAG: hypothetical protein RL220_218 [Bacteroidota bacterium]|jgi:alpha-beta hydrolase superfamily lysophospholipase